MRVGKQYSNFRTFGVCVFYQAETNVLFTGGKRKLQIPPKLAYGPEPAGCFSGTFHHSLYMCFCSMLLAMIYIIGTVVLVNAGDCNIPGNATLLYDINFVEIYPGSNTR